MFLFTRGFEKAAGLELDAEGSELFRCGELGIELRWKCFRAEAWKQYLGSFFFHTPESRGAGSAVAARASESFSHVARSPSGELEYAFEQFFVDGTLRCTELVEALRAEGHAALAGELVETERSGVYALHVEEHVPEDESGRTQHGWFELLFDVEAGTVRSNSSFVWELGRDEPRPISGLSFTNGDPRLAHYEWGQNLEHTAEPSEAEGEIDLRLPEQHGRLSCSWRRWPPEPLTTSLPRCLVELELNGAACSARETLSLLGTTNSGRYRRMLRDREDRARVGSWLLPRAAAESPDWKALGDGRFELELRSRLDHTAYDIDIAHFRERLVVDVARRHVEIARDFERDSSS